MLLEIQKINTFYGISQILFDVSLHVKQGEVISILGRNGMGKTTTLRSITRLTPPRSGKVLFDGIEVTGQPFKAAKLGIGFVPENRLIFPDLTVKENLSIGIRREGEWCLDRVYEFFPILKERHHQEGGTLSGGEQQMLSIARTLMMNPRLLILDEPSEGLAPLIVKDIERRIRNLSDDGMTILITEQNAGFCLRVSNRSYILEKGSVRWEGESVVLQKDDAILKRYLGI
jgi:branched-chain amino acid transport system ATP-binding protein